MRRILTALAALLVAGTLSACMSGPIGRPCSRVFGLGCESTSPYGCGCGVDWRRQGARRTWYTYEFRHCAWR
jgi:hypothetical protein